MAEARPNSGQVLNLLGQARLKLGRFAEALEPLERAAKFLPKDAAAQVNLAGCLSVLGDHAQALEALERAALLKPGDAALAHTIRICACAAANCCCARAIGCAGWPTMRRAWKSRPSAMRPICRAGRA